MSRKNKRAQREQDERNDFFKLMAQNFSRTVDREMTFSSNRNESGNVQHDNKNNERLLAKEVELQNREIELLRRENEILMRSSSPIMGYFNRQSQATGLPSSTFAIPNASVHQPNQENTNFQTARNSEENGNSNNLDVIHGNQFSFRDVQDSLTKFSGDDDYKVEKFFEDFQESALCFSWSEIQMVVYAKRLLMGTAKETLKFTKDVGTWQKFKSFMMSEFQKFENSATVHRKMADRKKASSESCRNYFVAMRQIGYAGGLEDEAIIQYTIDGIMDYPMNKSILYGANSVSEFKTKLDQYEEMKAKVQDTKKKNESSSEKVESSKPKHNRRWKGQRCYSCGARGHADSSCPKKNDGPKCFKCNQFGHIAPNCSQSQTSDKKKVSTSDINKSCAASFQISSLKNTMKEFKLNGKVVIGLVDCGSDLNLIRESKFRWLDCGDFEDDFKVFDGIGSRNNSTVGQFEANVLIDNEIYKTIFHIVPDSLMPYDILIGKELIDQTITIITPDSVLMKKADSFGCFSCVESENEISIDLYHIENKRLQAEVRNLIMNYKPKRCKITEDIEMKIVLANDIPVYQKPRRLAPLELEVARKQIDEWLSDGIIQHSKSNYASPIVLADKKDGTKRLCVDYRKLNNIIIKDRYPIPLIDDQIDQLRHAMFFTTLDLRNGFFHVPVSVDSQKYTAFITPFGHYEFKVVPFGLSNSPAVFQRFINNIFNELCLNNDVRLYMDDLIIPSVTEDEGILKLKKVLLVAEEHGLQIKWSKCEFLKRSVEYLGYIIECGTIKPSERKKLAIKKFPQPTNVKQLQQFLGLTGYFRRFVEDYSLISRPLTNLLRKQAIFKFESEEMQAFQHLKKILVSNAVLRIYSINANTELHTDASKFGLGAILLQKDDEDMKFHPVFYYSKKTEKREEKYPSYELEVLAIVTALKKLRHYLLGLSFVIVTDCAAFKGTMERKDLTSRIAGWALLLQEFNYRLEHRPSSKMRHVDALSRSPVVMMVSCDVTSRVKAAQKSDFFLKTIIDILKKTGDFEDYVLENGVLFKIVKGSRFLVVPKSMESEIIRSCHEKGHFGIQKTRELVMREFFMADLDKKVAKYIQNCVHCILIERKKGKQDGLLNPIPKGDRPFSCYHIDHLGNLVSTKKMYKYILSIIDGFSKFVWLYPTKTATTQEVLQKLKLQQNVFGNPERIICDRSTTFTSADFQSYCAEENIKLHFITTGAQTGNGQVENLNKTIIPVLAKLSRDNPDDWWKHVGRVQSCLNNTWHRAIQMSPFELMFGVKMRCTGDVRLKEIIEEEMNSLFDDFRQQLRNQARFAIDKIQKENLKNYNKRRKKAPLYSIGDWVVIKRTQFGSGLKLQNKYLGPYEIVKINQNDRYEVRKVSNSEGPITTTTTAEFMKRYYCGQSDESNSDGDSANTENDDIGDSEADDVDDTPGPSGSVGKAGGPSGFTDVSL